MQKKRLAYVALLQLLIAMPVISSAQATPPVISPEIHADKKITFRFMAPSAKNVLLSAQFEKSRLPMNKDTAGVWSITVGPVKPDIYPYNFIVDDIGVMDPANVNLFPNERFKASLVDIPGDTPLIHAMKAVPHGRIHYDYYSSMENSTGTLVVYTPPGYDKNPSVKYPVFYLISGTTDTEETFYKVGRVNLILDNLIASGKAKPMIVVMPYGNTAAKIAAQKGAPRPADPAGRESEEALTRSKLFETDLVTNILPFVEKNYRVTANRENRAVGGFSRGGGQTLRAAFGNQDKFAWVCCYSAYLSPTEMEKRYSAIYSNPAQTNKQFKLLWVSVGDEDFLYKPTVEFLEFLKAKDVKYKSLITTGGHTWMNVKTYLAETLPLLFR